MGVGSFVEGSLIMYASNRLDVALALACSAVEATSSRVFPDVKKNNDRCKQLLRENLVVVTSFGFPGIIAADIQIKCTPASGLRADANGYVGIEDILYHTVRCGLLHECDIDRKIQFTSGTRIGDFDFTFSVPKAVVLGLLSVVILHPANKDETASVGASIPLGGTHHHLNDIWGTGLSVVGVPSAQIRAARMYPLHEPRRRRRRAERVPRYVDWAVRMKRTWGFDVLRCPRCSRRMQVIATIVDPTVVRKIVEHGGVRASPLLRAPPRDPEAYAEQADFDFEPPSRQTRRPHPPAASRAPRNPGARRRCVLRQRFTE